MVDLNWPALRSLRELAARGTMTAAAEALGYSTGAVSQQLSALEAMLGSPLLVRRGRNVQLTDAGELLAAHAAELIDAQHRALEQVRGAASEAVGRVRLGMFATVAASMLPTILARSAVDLPEVSVQSQEIAVDDVTAAVHRGGVDLGLGLDYPGAPIPRERDTVLRLLRRESLSLVTARTVNLPSTLDLNDAADLDWILPPANTHFGTAILSACRRSGFEPRAVHEVNDTATSLALVAQGLGVTLASPLMLGLGRVEALSTSELTEPVERHLILVEPSLTPPRRSVSAVASVIEDVVTNFVPSLNLSSGR